jgi:hypothetical protein
MNLETHTEGSNAEIDIHKLLAKRFQIAVIWSIEDVQAIRSDLSKDQARQVLLKCRQHHDCTLGLTWETLEEAADSLFPLSASKVSD